jgi:nucleoside-diphosphate-sugar epimerase
MTAQPGAKRVLVTGGTGFVGANLVRRLLADGHDVAVLAKKETDAWRLADVSTKVHWLHAGLDRSDALEDALGEVKPQWIFHLAAHGAYSWQRDGAAISKTNVLGTANLLEACLEAGFEAFVNTGSSSEYGFKDHAPKEDEALEPTGPYAVAKAAATLYCTQAARSTGARIATLRLYSVYGPWEEPRRFIPQLVARGLEGALPPLASPQTARDYVYVDDVTAAFVAVATGDFEPGAVFNVGTGRQTTLEDAVDLARRVLHVEVEPDWGSMADRSWDTSTWVADSSRLQDQLGWRPATELEQGLRLTASWLSAHPELSERYRTPDTTGSPAPPTGKRSGSPRRRT